MRGKVSFTSYLVHVNAGNQVPLLVNVNPLERERLACLLVRCRYAGDMPQRSELSVV